MKPKKIKRVEIQAAAVLVDQWRKAAERHGLDLSGWIRMTLIAAAAEQKQGAKQ